MTGIFEKSTIAKNVRVARARSNLSQKELALKSGVCETTISFIENGKQSVIRASTLNKLASALCVDIEDLVKND